MITRMKMALIIKNLTVTYNKENVLDNVNLNIPQGKMVAVIGPNGAGKTTLLKAVLNIIKPQKGKIIFTSLEEGQWNCPISYVPQSSSVDWEFPVTVLDVVMMGRYGHLGWLRRAGKKEKKIAMEMLDKVGMLEYKDRQIGQLSGGQKQRVFLARALVQKAEIYLLDEPFKGVDVSTEAVIIRLLKELRDDGKTVIVVHHDLDTVESYFDWAILINKHIVANGAVEDIFNEIYLHQLYHGSEINYKKVS